MSKENDFQEFLNDFVNSTSRVLIQVGETILDGASRGREAVATRMKERVLNKALRTLGKDVFTLHARGKITLPEELLTHIDTIKTLIVEIDAERSETDD